MCRCWLITFYLSYETVCDASSVDNGSNVASPKIFWTKMFDFSRIKHYFVLYPASQSRKWPYVLNIWGGKADRWLRLWTADQAMVECMLRRCITSLSYFLMTMWCGPVNVVVMTEASKSSEAPHKRRLRCPNSYFPCCIWNRCRIYSAYRAPCSCSEFAFPAKKNYCSQI